MTNLAIEEVNNIEEFQALKEQWNLLLEQCSDNNIFLAWEWLFTWWQYFGNDKKLRILLIKEGNNIIGIAPFMLTTYREGFFKCECS